MNDENIVNICDVCRYVYFWSNYIDNLFKIVDIIRFEKNIYCVKVLRSIYDGKSLFIMGIGIYMILLYKKNDYIIMIKKDIYIEY